MPRQPQGDGRAERAFAALAVRARWILGLAALLTGLALWSALGLRVQVDLSGLIGPQTAGAAALRDYAGRFGPVRAEEVLLVSAPTLADEAALEAFEALVLDLQFVDGVEQVISLWSLPAPGRAGARLADPDLAALPPADRLRTLRAADPLAEQLLAADLTATVVVVAPGRGQGGPDFLAGLRAAMAAHPPLRVELVGLAEVQRAIAGELVADLRRLIPLATLICLAVAAAMFRDWRPVLACALPPVVGLVWFGGWLGAAGLAIDPVMGALPVVLIVLGFSDALHLHHAAAHGSGDGGAAARVARAAAETAPAAVLTSVTTMIAFASLALPESPSLNRLALTGTVGVAILLAAVLVLTPALMALLGTPAPGARPPRAFAAVVPPALRALAWRGTPLAALALLALLAAAQSRSAAGFNYSDYLPVGAPVTLALERAEGLGLGADRLVVVVEAAPAIGPGPEANARAAALAVWGEDRADWLDSTAGAEMLRRMRAHDGSAHALPVQLPISAAGARADAGLKALEDRLAAAGLAGVARVVGPGQALVAEGPRLAEGLRTGLYLTIAAATLLIAAIHRSARIAAVSVVPNLIPILGVEAWLVVTGREITIMNMIALTVAFGIAVDDTLHLLNRLRLARGPDAAGRLAEAVQAAGPPMAATTLVLLAGLTVTLTSALPGLAVFGALIGLAVVLALVADLFLLPALLRGVLR